MPGIQDLTGKTAVVTGGGSGIGAGMSRRFAQRGMRVVVADIDLDAAGKLAESLRSGGAEAVAVEVDVSDRGSLEALAQASLAAFGDVDVLCNNAGVFLGGKMADFTPGDWDWVMSVNLMGVVHGCSVFRDHFTARGSGQIVNTASIGGFAADPGCAPYTTSKFAVVGYSEALRRDLEPEGVGVSILCPGPVATGIDRCDRLRPASAGESAVSSKAAVPVIEQGMHPDEVGDLVVRGIASNAIYVFTHKELAPMFEQRITDLRAALEDTPAASGSAVTPEDLA